MTTASRRAVSGAVLLVALFLVGLPASVLTPLMPEAKGGSWFISIRTGGLTGGWSSGGGGGGGGSGGGGGGGGGGGAPRADAGAVLAMCLARFDALVMDVEMDMLNVVAQTETALDRLDRRGATDRQLEKQANRGRKACRSIARNAMPELNRIEGDCLIQLLRAQASPEQVRTMRFAADETIERIRDALDQSYVAIDEALAERLGN